MQTRISRSPVLPRRGLLPLGAVFAARCAAGPDAPCGFASPNAVPVVMARGLPYLPMTVNGWPVTALLDTGAQRTLVAETLLPSLKLPIDPRRLAFQQGVTGRTDSRPLAYLPQVRLGSLVIASLEVGVVAQLGMRAPDGNPPQMVLGGDVLTRHDLDLDLPARRLTLYPAQRCRMEAPPFAPRFYALPMRVARNHIITEVEANGRMVEVLLDTGAMLNQISRSRAVALGVTPEELAAAPQHQVRGINNQLQPVALIRLASLRIGPESHVNVPTLVGADGPADFIIGTPWLIDRRLFVSYGNQRLFVAAPPGMALPSPAPVT